MKNLVLATCFAAGIGTSPAGPGDGEYPAATLTRATTLTRALAQRIHFNEGQYVAVKRLHLQMLSERRDLETRLAGAGPAVRDEQLAAAQQRYETQLAALLQPEQRMAYQQLRANLTAHRLR